MTEVEAVTQMEGAMDGESPEPKEKLIVSLTSQPTFLAFRFQRGEGKKDHGKA